MLSFLMILLPKYILAATSPYTTANIRLAIPYLWPFSKTRRKPTSQPKRPPATPTRMGRERKIAETAKA